MTLKLKGDEVDIRFGGESVAYRKARNKLLKAEIELKDERERVARMRRELPLGAKVETDYVFQEGPRDVSQEGPIREVRLSQLFEDGKDELVLINTMFGPEAAEPCSMCNMWADGYDAVAPHVEQQKNFALVTRKDIRSLRAWARGRGWRNIRLLSSRESTFNRDFNVEWEEKVFEGPNGLQIPGVTVFRRLADGDIHHTYSVEAAMSPKEHRAIDLFTPVWNLFDLTPTGRAATWYPKTKY